MSKIDEINNIIQENKLLRIISTKDISDGHHTFGELYKNRIIVFCTLCNLLPDISWKSKSIMMKKLIQYFLAILLQE